MDGQRRSAVDEFFQYYVHGPSYRMQLPAPLVRAVQQLVDGRLLAAIASLDLVTPENSSEELLVELLYGWGLTENGEFDRAARHIDRAMALANELDHEGAHSWITALAGTNSFVSGRRDEGFRLMNRAAALASPGSVQSMAALYVLSQTLRVSRAPAAGEAVLLELLNTREWPPYARAKIGRRLARIWIELGKDEELAVMMSEMPDVPGTDRDRVEHAILLAYNAITVGDLERARVELIHAREILERMEVPHLTEDCDQISIALIAEEARLTQTPESIDALNRTAEDLEISHLTSSVQGIVIDALSHSGNFELAWRLSNEVVRTHLEEGVDMRGVFDLTIMLSDSQAEAQFASELGSKHERLQLLEERAGAVLSALSHGVRDPLTVLQLWFADQPDDLMAEPTKRGLVDAAVERIERLLDQVVWLARADRYVPDVIHRSIDLGRLGASAIELHRNWADFRELDLIFRSSSSTMGTDASDGVAAIVSALLSHATAFSREGGCVELHLQLQSESLSIAVIDDGLPPSDEASTSLEQQWSSGLVSPRGTDGDATGDVGWVLAQALVALFGSSISIDVTADGRTQCSTLLPLQVGSSRIGQEVRWNG